VVGVCDIFRRMFDNDFFVNKMLIFIFMQFAFKYGKNLIHAALFAAISLIK